MTEENPFAGELGDQMRLILERLEDGQNPWPMPGWLELDNALTMVVLAVMGRYAMAMMNPDVDSQFVEDNTPHDYAQRLVEAVERQYLKREKKPPFEGFEH